MFIQPCFIKKNTNWIRNRLEIFGYTLVENGLNEWHIPIEKLSYLKTTIDGKYIGVNGNWSSHCYIDCGDNKDLFLALAALRDDSDKYQWFVSDEGTFRYSLDDVFDVGMANYVNYNVTHWHKANSEELIKYFNDYACRFFN